ncbi:MAG TPA: hypothetical protein VIE67_11065 [Rudaea sp.]|jgi:hypothetical protein|uniref:hypothetical protein n=1 Tax=Rudaea sp. TaxID=2136325 RepID=UPI002F95D9CA
MLKISMMLIMVVLATCPTAQCKEQNGAGISTAAIGALLAGRYDNSAQVAQAQGKATAENPAPPHVTVAIEPTQQPDWALWRVHMDVDADTALDAVWAMNTSRRAFDKSLALIPYTLRPSVNAATVSAAAFDETQWLSLEACALRGDFGKSRINAHSEGEPCAAAGMGIGGKRAFLPASIEREGDRLRVQLILRGTPLRVDARRLP